MYMYTYMGLHIMIIVLCPLHSGRCAVSYMLSLSDNVTSLLPFIEPRGSREHDNKLAKSSVSSRYAAVLLLQLLQSESVAFRGNFFFIYTQQVSIYNHFVSLVCTWTLYRCIIVMLHTCICTVFSQVKWTEVSFFCTATDC